MSTREPADRGREPVGGLRRQSVPVSTLPLSAAAELPRALPALRASLGLRGATCSYSYPAESGTAAAGE